MPDGTHDTVARRPHFLAGQVTDPPRAPGADRLLWPGQIEAERVATSPEQEPVGSLLAALAERARRLGAARPSAVEVSS